MTEVGINIVLKYVLALYPKLLFTAYFAAAKIYKSKNDEIKSHLLTLKSPFILEMSTFCFSIFSLVLCLLSFLSGKNAHRVNSLCIQELAKIL